MKNFKSVSLLSVHLNDSTEILRQCALNPTLPDDVRIQAQRSLSMLYEHALRLVSELSSSVIPAHLKPF